MDDQSENEYSADEHNVGHYGRIFVPGTILPAGIGYRTAVKLQLTCHVGENVPALSVSMNKFSVARLAIVDLRSGPLAGLPWRIFQLI